MENLNQLRDQVGAWAREKFGEPTAKGRGSLLGALEGIGRALHAHMEQGDDAEVRAAIGYAVVYLADYCSIQGFDFDLLVKEAWADAQVAEWKKKGRGEGETG